MRLTKQTNYALRIMMYCAAKGNALSTASEIAKAYGLSELFLSKIIRPLVHKGFLVGKRGRNGGVKLARPAKSIRLSEVIRTTEDNFDMAECFKDGVDECPLVNACELNIALRKALNAFFNVLDKYTIEDLASNRFRIDKLLGIEVAITPAKP